MEVYINYKGRGGRNELLTQATDDFIPNGVEFSMINKNFPGKPQQATHNISQGLEIQSCVFCTIIQQPAFFSLIRSIISFKVHLGKIRSTLGDQVYLFILLSNIPTVTLFPEIILKRELFMRVGFIDLMKLNLIHPFGGKNA